MRMTLTYARISDRTIADEYFRVTEDVEDAYRTAQPLPAGHRSRPMRNASLPTIAGCSATGTAPDPIALDCQFETICESCGFYDTGPEFVEIIRRQQADAIDHADHDRAAVFTGLLDDIDNDRLTMLR